MNNCGKSVCPLITCRPCRVNGKLNCQNEWCVTRREE